MINTYEAVNQLLRDEATITAVTTGIYTYPPGLPNDYEGSDEAILIISDGLGEADSNAIQYESVQVRCYAGTITSAIALAVIVVNVLHRKQGEDVTLSDASTVRLYDCRLTNGPTPSEEFESGYQYVLLTFSMQWSDRSV